MLLYIILFKKADIIKIGISQTIDRIRQHTRTYKDIEPDLKNSYIVRASDQRDIKILEQQLLQDYIDDSIKLDLGTRDGYTELRDSRILDMVLEDIKYKGFRFPYKKISVTKGIKLTPNNERHKRCTPEKKIGSKLHRECDEYNRSAFDNWSNAVAKHRGKITSTTITSDRINIVFDEVDNKDVDELVEWNLRYIFHSKKGMSGNNLSTKEYSPNGKKDRLSLSVHLDAKCKINQQFLDNVCHDIVDFSHKLPNVTTQLHH